MTAHGQRKLSRSFTESITFFESAAFRRSPKQHRLSLWNCCIHTSYLWKRTKRAFFAFRTRHRNARSTRSRSCHARRTTSPARTYIFHWNFPSKECIFSTFDKHADLLLGNPQYTTPSLNERFDCWPPIGDSFFRYLRCTCERMVSYVIWNIFSKWNMDSCFFLEQFPNAVWVN